jgi:hypothetical protein
LAVDGFLNRCVTLASAIGPSIRIWTSVCSRGDVDELAVDAGDESTLARLAGLREPHEAKQ